MASFNKVILLGNLTRDPQVRYTPGGQAVSEIGLAVNSTWFNKKANQRKEEVTFVEVVLWGRTAEIAGEYLRKGSKVYIEGRLQTRKLHDQGGQDRYSTEIVANDLQMLDGRGASEGAFEGGSAGSSAGAAAASGGVLIVGVDKLLTAPAKCCRPAPPDPIVGFVTRGRGVSVHRAGCASLSRLDPARHIAAEWGEPGSAKFPVEIVVDAVDRTGLLRDISEVLSRERINVIATRSTSTDLSARMRFTVEIADLGQLQKVLALIGEVKGVLSAKRK